MDQNVIDIKRLVAHDFRTAMYGKLADSDLDKAVEDLLQIQTKYPAQGSIVSMIFYFQIQLDIKNGGKQFNGKAGGISTPGGGALFGDVYTDDINRLYANTVSIQFNSTPVYFSLLFFDSNSNLLGTFQSGAVSTVAGIGGGTGKWT